MDPPPPPPAVAVVPKPPRYNSSQHNPVFTATTVSDKSPLNIQSFPQSKNPNYDDLSFSSYVRPKEKADEEPEISIFDAQKYFCEINDNNNNKNLNQDPRLSSVSSEGYGRNFRTGSFNATPTASSEASWNSQTGLLANPPGSAAVNVKKSAASGDHGLQRKSSGKKWIFGRRCCCTGKKSVRVKEATVVSAAGPAETKNGPRVKGGDVVRHVATAPEPPLPRQQRISATGRAFVDGSGGFSFPILKNPTQTVRGIRPVEEDPPRDSLEVFQPVGVGGRHLFKPGSPIGRVVVASTDDDMGSDASSDLFELESFSTQTTSYPTYRRRDSLDDAQIFGARRLAGGDRRIVDDEAPATPSVAGTECYAPSEVSVDWSVTTAEGFDRASVSNFSVSASEAGGGAFNRRGVAGHEEGDGGVGKRKGGGGGLLMMSCRQGKAVSVGPQPVRFVPAGAEGGVAASAGGRPPRGSKTAAAEAMGGDRVGRTLAFAA